MRYNLRQRGTGAHRQFIRAAAQQQEETPMHALHRHPLRHAGLLLLGGLALMPTIALGAEAGPGVTFPDCGAMWLEGAKARTRLDVYSGLLSRRDAVVRFDVPREVVTGPDAPPAVFECLPGDDKGREPKLVPVPAIVAALPDGSAQVSWTMSGAAAAMSQKRYHVYYPQPGASGLQGGARPGEPVALPGENLLVNASFEKIDPADANNPQGWFVSGTVAEGTRTLVGVRTNEAARSGSFAFRSVAPGGAGGVATLAQPLRVRAGVSYVLEAWVKLAANAEVNASLDALFLDAQGQPIGSRVAAVSTSSHRVGDWVQLRGFGAAPLDAQFVRVQIGAVGNGAALFDDVSLFADPIGMGPAPRVVPMPVEDRPRFREPLRLQAGGEAWLFDFGPADSRVAGGFLPADPSKRLLPSELYGFCGEGGSSAEAGPRPDALAQDFVQLGPDKFCVRLPDGPVTVWMLFGDYRPAPPGPFVPPALYTTPVAVQAGTQAKRLENPLLNFSALHFEAEDDAVLSLRSGAFAVYERYVEPRFVQTVFESEVRNGVLEVLCQPAGACPIAALGVFRGATETQVREELAYYTALRKWSFTVHWAQPVEPPTHRAPLVATQDEQRLGFAVFAVDTDSDIYPHTSPTREQISAMAAGISVKLAPGESTAASFGVYPLVFRRSLALDVVQPITPIGATLGARPVELSVVRYRAERLRANGPDPRAAQSPDPRWALRPSELMSPAGEGVRPGLTRQVWLNVHAAEGTAPGRYQGTVVLDAGQGRTLELPLSVDVVNAKLGPTAVHQGVLGGEWAPGGDLARMYADWKDHGIDIVDLASPPIASWSGGDASADFSPWTDRVAAAERGGLVPAALVSAFTGEPAFELTREPTRDPGYQGAAHHRAKSSFSKAFDAVFTMLVRQANSLASSKRWPPLVHLVSAHPPDAGDATVQYERHLLEACKAAGGGGFCAAAIHARSSFPNLSVMDAALPQPSVSLDRDAWAALHATEKKQPRRSVWLLGAGGARYDRGMYAWAMGADAVLSRNYTSLEGAGDPTDDWDSEARYDGYVRPGAQGPVASLRWERAKLGAADARLLSHVARRAAEAEKKGGAAAATAESAQRFLRELATKISATMGDPQVGWDGRARANGFPQGPDFDLLRSALLDLAASLE
jgi:hypothetical protein